MFSLRASSTISLLSSHSLLFVSMSGQQGRNTATAQCGRGRANKVGASINPFAGADLGEAVIKEGPGLGAALGDAVIGEGLASTVGDQVAMFDGVNPRPGVKDSAAARIGRGCRGDQRGIQGQETNPHHPPSPRGPVKGIGPTEIRRHLCSFYKEEDTGCCIADISLCHRPIQEFSKEFMSVTRNNIEIGRMTRFSNQGASRLQQLDEDAYSVGGSTSTPQASGSIECRPRLNMFAFPSSNDNKAWEWIECLEGEDWVDAEWLRQQALREDFLDKIYHEMVECIDQQLEKAIADILYSKLKSVVSAINTRVLTNDTNVAISNIPGSGNTLHDQMRCIERKRGLSAIIMDNATNMRLVGRKFEAKFEDMWSVSCQYHALNFVLMFWADWLRSQPATTTETTNQALMAMEDFNFWVGVEKVMQLMEPVVMAIKFFDRSTSTIGFVWQAWHFLKFKTAVVIGFNAKDKQLLEDFLQKWEDQYMRSCDLFGAAWCVNLHYREDRNRQEATAAFSLVRHCFYPNAEDTHKLNQEYFAYINGTGPFSIVDSRDAQELLEKGKDGDSPWYVWASVVSFNCDSGAVL
ncbi:hypothetical protein SELMODRAFT_414779 [Selaginella moellendorffii]|uniref:DUF659 domain-containing protein n=1 Tax=Selaginella moellendorffii TaxID=88036 RepID=D8RUL0_SELML|nr:hypothetical protein SELMODRAFT_414779 [Selaginella moellendorffii]